MDSRVIQFHLHHCSLRPIKSVDIVSIEHLCGTRLFA